MLLSDTWCTRLTATLRSLFIGFCPFLAPMSMQVMHLQFFLALRLEIQSAWNLLGQTVHLITTSSGMKSPRQTSHQSRWILITLYLMPHENERSIVFWLLLSPAPAPVVAAVIAVPAIAVVVFCKPSKSHYERSHGWPIKKKSRGKFKPHFLHNSKNSRNREKVKFLIRS